MTYICAGTPIVFQNYTPLTTAPASDPEPVAAPGGFVPGISVILGKRSRQGQNVQRDTVQDPVHSPLKKC